MSTDKTYYTPEFEELHVGLECEIDKSTFHEKYEFSSRGGFDERKDFTPKWGSDKIMQSDLQLQEPLSNKIRVKKLDREDIESLGWEFIMIGAFGNTFYCDKETKMNSLIVSANFASLTLKANNEHTLHHEQTVFFGYLRNKSELKNQMIRCRILKKS